MAHFYEPQQVRQAFDRAAERYDAHATLQQEVAARLFDRLKVLLLRGSTLLDMGCGTGQIARLNHADEDRWKLMQMDISPRMCVRASAHAPAAAADARALPFPPESFHGIISSLTLQWVDDLPRCFRECHAVLKNGGVLAFSTFGPATLFELRESFRALGEEERLSSFPPAQDVARMVVEAGFVDISCEREIVSQYHTDTKALMHALRAIGATHKAQNRRKYFTGRAFFERLEQVYRERFAHEGLLPETWEVLVLTMNKP